MSAPFQELIGLKATSKNRREVSERSSLKPLISVWISTVIERFCVWGKGGEGYKKKGKKKPYNMAA